MRSGVQRPDRPPAACSFTARSIRWRSSFGGEVGGSPELPRVATSGLTPRPCDRRPPRSECPTWRQETSSKCLRRYAAETREIARKGRLARLSGGSLKVGRAAPKGDSTPNIYAVSTQHPTPEGTMGAADTVRCCTRTSGSPPAATHPRRTVRGPLHSLPLDYGSSNLSHAGPRRFCVDDCHGTDPGFRTAGLRTIL